MASASGIRHTVLRLIGLFRSSDARFARSVVDWRLNGFPVWATTSHAIEVTIARSKGGKAGLAAASGIVVHGESPVGPALTPPTHAVRVHVEPSRRLDVGQRRLLVQHQHRAGPLPSVRGRHACGHEASGPREERIGKTRARTR